MKIYRNNIALWMHSPACTLNPNNRCTCAGFRCGESNILIEMSGGRLTIGNNLLGEVYLYKIVIVGGTIRGFLYDPKDNVHNWLQSI